MEGARKWLKAGEGEGQGRQAGQRQRRRYFAAAPAGSQVTASPSPVKLSGWAGPLSARLTASHNCPLNSITPFSSHNHHSQNRRHRFPPRPCHCQSDVCFSDVFLTLCTFLNRLPRTSSPSCLARPPLLRVRLFVQLSRWPNKSRGRLAAEQAVNLFPRRGASLHCLGPIGNTTLCRFHTCPPRYKSTLARDGR